MRLWLYSRLRVHLAIIYKAQRPCNITVLMRNWDTDTLGQRNALRIFMGVLFLIIRIIYKGTIINYRPASIIHLRNYYRKLPEYCCNNLQILFHMLLIMLDILDRLVSCALAAYFYDLWIPVSSLNEERLAIVWYH